MARILNVLDSVDPDINMFSDHSFDHVVANTNDSLTSCKYFSVDEYCHVLDTGNSSISLINFNVRSFEKMD